MSLGARGRSTAGPGVEPSPARMLVALVAAGLTVYVLGSWIRLLAAGADTIDDKDWVGFYRVGWLFWRGDLSRLYGEVVHSQQPFLYPPFAVWLCAPLGLWASPWPPYLACAATAVAGALVAVVVAAKTWARTATWSRVLAAAIVLVASAPWLGCVTTGQLSGLLLAALMGSLAAWRAGRPLLAGLLLAVLALKPNVLALILLPVVVGRHGRVLAGLALGLATLLASTAPLGLSLWSDYRAASARVVDLAFAGELAPWMHQTLLAFWIWAAGEEQRVDLAWLGWMITAAVATALVVRSWWARRPEQVARRLGQAVLFAVAVTPYLYVYDGLLLALPALVWFFDRGSYVRESSWRACGLCLAAIFVWQQVAMFAHYTGCPPLVGPLCLLWLAIDVRELSATASPRG